jgi:hypothetical protein
VQPASVLGISRQDYSCKISGSHGGDYEDCHFLGCGAVWFLLEPTFRRNLSLPQSRNVLQLLVTANVPSSLIISI